MVVYTSGCHPPASQPDIFTVLIRDTDAADHKGPEVLVFVSVVAREWRGLFWSYPSSQFASEGTQYSVHDLSEDYPTKQPARPLTG